jgi:hypothetical protein
MTTNQTNDTNVLLAKPFANTFRFNFSDTVLEKLTQFSKMNKSYDRHAFKEAWKEWLSDNKNMVLEETERLTTLGYDGDITEKMYVSVRYYLRKKGQKQKKERLKQDKDNYHNKDFNIDFHPNDNTIESVDVSPKCKNIPTNRLLLDAMDKHILQHCQNPNYRPANGFESFCRDNIEICKEEVKRLANEYKITNSQNIQEKIKKTYKNRYYIIKKNADKE